VECFGFPEIIGGRVKYIRQFDAGRCELLAGLA
jgi:hypothetical protein